MTVSHTSIKPLHFGLVGCGRIAPTHFNAIEALGDKGRLVAVCDSNDEALTQAVKQTGAKGYASLDRMLENSDVTIVSICTPSGLHAEHGIMAAKAGKHVLVEKPIDVNLEKARELIQTCEAAGVRLFPVFQNRLNPTMVLLKEAVDKGRFGKIYAINSTVIWKRTQEYYDADAWRGTAAMDGGAFMNQGIHFLDAMCYLGGDVTDVTSMLGTLAREIECEDTGSALLRFKNGALGNLFITMLGQTDQEGSLTVIGEKGTVKLGGTALNTIEQWDFQEPDAAMDAQTNNMDYITKSVYGYGHEAFYKNISGHTFQESDTLTSLRCLMDIVKNDEHL